MMLFPRGPMGLHGESFEQLDRAADYLDGQFEFDQPVRVYHCSLFGESPHVGRWAGLRRDGLVGGWSFVFRDIDSGGCSRHMGPDLVLHVEGVAAGQAAGDQSEVKS